MKLPSEVPAIPICLSLLLTILLPFLTRLVSKLVSGFSSTRLSGPTRVSTLSFTSKTLTGTLRLRSCLSAIVWFVSHTVFELHLFCYLGVQPVDECAGGHFVRCVVWLPVGAAPFADLVASCVYVFRCLMQFGQFRYGCYWFPGRFSLNWRLCNYGWVSGPPRRVCASV